MTHDKLRDLVDKYDAAGMVDEPAVKALRAVVELHKPFEIDRELNYNCTECEWAYPCSTIQAIMEQLK